MVSDPSTVVGGVALFVDEKEIAIVEENKKLTAATATAPSSSSSCQEQNPKPQNWDDEGKMESSKRKLHQRYEEVENRKRKRQIQILDVNNLPKPCKPSQQRRVVNKNKFLVSKKCRAF